MPKADKLSELLVILYQSRRLLEKLFSVPSNQQPFSGNQILAELGDDQQKFQLLVKSGVIYSHGQGYSLNPVWFDFFQQQLAPALPDLHELAYLIEKAKRTILSIKNQKGSIHLLIPLINRIEQYWLTSLEAIGPPEDKVTLQNCLKKWDELIWIDLRALWDIESELDQWLIGIWKRAEEIQAKVKLWDQEKPFVEEKPMLHILRQLQLRRSYSPQEFHEVAEKVLLPNRDLWWANLSAKNLKVSLELLSAEKPIHYRIRNRKKKSSLLLPNDKRVEQLPRKISEQPLNLHGLFENFSKQEKELGEFMAEHANYTHLSEEEKNEICLQFLFQYGDKVDWKTRNAKEKGLPFIFPLVH
ncbi:MAG: hypothetical protein AAFY71_08230 [Bacteroidota bacterium]